MKQKFGWLVSHILFILGDWVSKTMYYSDLFSWLYIVYNKLMCWSVDVQDWSKCNGPWQTPTKQKKRTKRIVKRMLNETESQ